MKKEKPKLHNYDSDQEWYFTWWLDEMKANGFIESWFYKPKQFDLTRGFYYFTTDNTKKKPKTTQYTLAQPQTYTPDFLIIWSKKGEKFFKRLQDHTSSYFISYPEEKDHFFWAQSEPYQYSSYIDIKPKFTRRDSETALFSLKRALMLQLHKTHVQAVIIEKLFESTFTPQRFLRCDVSTKPRTIHWKINNVTEM